MLGKSSLEKCVKILLPSNTKVTHDIVYENDSILYIFQHWPWRTFLEERIKLHLFGWSSDFIVVPINILVLNYILPRLTPTLVVY